MDRPRRLAVALALAALWGCGGARAIPDDREAAFAYAVERLQAGDDAAAAAAAWRYYKGASPEDPRYDRALRLLARSAEGLGLTWAASLWYLEIAEARRAPALVPEAVRGLRRIVEGGPHDEDSIVRGFVAVAELEGLPTELQAFVDYHRGLQNARQRLRWTDARFARLPPGPYRARAEYVQAVRKAAARDTDGARAALEALLEADPPADVALDARRSLARLAMDREAWADAIPMYEALRELAPDDPELLLEMAWAHYHVGDSRRALGLLLALDAPAYRGLIAPDRFLLEALALRRLCQFGPARRAAVRLRARHGDALQDLYAGVPLAESGALRRAARRRPELRAQTAFVDRVEAERALARDRASALGPGRGPGLSGLYDRGVTEARRQLDAALGTELDRLAEELLAAEEGVRLILHELGVGLLRGRRRPAGPPEPPAPEVAAGDDRVSFRFDGEFWTDELDDLTVVAEDRCLE